MKKIVRIAVLLSAALCMATGAWAGQVNLDGAFDPDRQTYSATVAHDVSEVTVNASPQNPNARVTVNGRDPSTPVPLVVGVNTIVVVVTAPDARYTRTYTITVTRQAAPLTTVRMEDPPAQDNQQGEPQQQEAQPQEEESQTQQGAGDPPDDQGEVPSDDGGGDKADGEPQPEEQEPQPEEQEPQQQQAKDASLDLTGTDGNDDLQGGDAGDVLAGKKGDDLLAGKGGNDELRGGKGSDQLRGGRGADTLYGGDGDDLLVGGRGADRLLGGSGDDTYIGGSGADRFVFISGETGDKIITDFGDGADQIVLKTEAFVWPSVADIIAGVVAQGDRYLVYTLSPGLTVETDTPLRPEDFRVN